jgi:hypothetical protein
VKIFAIINKNMLLYTLGDSFTYGEELPDPATQSWPALLANKLGYDLRNRGRPGCGNNYMIKTAIKEVPVIKPDLVIVSWTSCGRMEFADRCSVYDIWPGSDRKFERPSPHRRTLEKYITTYNNEQHQYRSWLRSVILLQDFFKLRNINYRFINTFNNQQLSYKYLTNSKVYSDLIDTQQFLGWPYSGIVEWASGCPVGPRHHPLESGHVCIANAIAKLL